jgi:hypothetical protein
MEVSELQEIVFQVLRDLHTRLGDGKNESQLLQDLNTGNITNKVSWIAYKAGLWKPSERLHQENEIYTGEFFPSGDVSTVRSIMWRLVGLGMLTPRSIHDERNQFFELTSYGKQVLKETKESPYDPLGFITRLTSDCPNLESNTVDYIKEAISCFLSRYLRAASVMIGLASENEILRLIDQYANTLDVKSKHAFEAEISKCRNIKQKFDILYSRLLQDKGNLPVEIRELDTWLQGVFQVIRLYRNDAGHPIGANPSSEDVFANLVLFRTYARYLSKLKEYLASKATP